MTRKSMAINVGDFTNTNVSPFLEDWIECWLSYLGRFDMDIRE